MQNNTFLKQGLLLEYATLGWNILGCIILAVAAFHAHSIALLGFGIDSVIEIFASVLVVWQLKATHKKDEKKVLRLIGSAFILLAIYLIAQSSWALAHGVHPQQSITGIIWLALTCLVMFSLAYGKDVVGKKLSHAILQAEAKVTVVDGILAGAVLVSLLLNMFFGIWWVDAVAGFVIALYSIKEGTHAWKE